MEFYADSLCKMNTTLYSTEKKEKRRFFAGYNLEPSPDGFY